MAIRVTLCSYRKQSIGLQWKSIDWFLYGQKIGLNTKPQYSKKNKQTNKQKKQSGPKLLLTTRQCPLEKFYEGLLYEKKLTVQSR